MRQTAKATAAALLVVAGMTAQAAEPKTLTLACQGTMTDSAKPDAKPEPISMGIIVNFTARTVQGFVHALFQDSRCPVALHVEQAL